MNLYPLRLRHRSPVKRNLSCASYALRRRRSRPSLLRLLLRLLRLLLRLLFQLLLLSPFWKNCFHMR